MRKVRIVYGKAGTRADAEGAIEVASLWHVPPTTIGIDENAGRALIKLLGLEFNERRFHLIDGNTMYTRCLIVGMGPVCTIQYRGRFPFPHGDPMLTPLFP